MCEFQLEMHEMHKTADSHSNLLVSEGHQGRLVKCAHFERPLPGIVILWFINLFTLAQLIDIIFRV